jgi:hypothetical protein
LILVFTRVGTYVQHGSKFCFVVLVVVADTLIRILHFRPISPCFQHIAPLHAALPRTLAQQPCPAALPSSLARQTCPAALPGSLCLAALPGILACQPCPAALPGSLAEKFASCFMQYCILLLGWQFSSSFPRN